MENKVKEIILKISRTIGYYRSSGLTNWDEECFDYLDNISDDVILYILNNKPNMNIGFFTKLEGFNNYCLQRISKMRDNKINTIINLTH